MSTFVTSGSTTCPPARPWSEEALTVLKSSHEASAARKVKTWTRKGVPLTIRVELWLQCTGAADFLSTYVGFYEEMLREMFGESLIN